MKDPNNVLLLRKSTRKIIAVLIVGSILIFMGIILIRIILIGNHFFEPLTSIFSYAIIVIGSIIMMRIILEEFVKTIWKVVIKIMEDLDKEPK